MEFSVGEYVMYGTSGVCKLSSIEKRNFDGQSEKQYLKLEPLNSSTSKYYIPSDSAENKIRKLLSKDEINSLIDEMPETEEIWFNDTSQRKAVFNSIIKSDDYKQIISMVKSLHSQKIKKISGGKRLNSSDENFMKRAENLMYQEFAAVLGIKQDEVEKYITDRIEN
jgi:CarD family transcriptional regulator